MKTNQFYRILILTSVSSEASLTRSESDSEGDEELNDTIATDNYYKTRNDAVEWKRNIPSQRGRPSGINIIDANTIGPPRKCLKVSSHLLKPSIYFA